VPAPRTLITGAGGFIGSHLARRLADLGWQTTLTALTLGDELRRVSKLSASTRLVTGDLGNLLQGGKFDEPYEFIFHMAGSSTVPESIDAPVKDLQRNALLTLQLLEHCRKRENRPKVIICSSAAVYGNPNRVPIKEGDPTLPVSPYGVSKLAAEHYGRIYHELHSVPIAMARPFSVYGPGQHKLVIYEILKQLLENGQAVHLRGDGSQLRDFIHINDLIDALLLVADKGEFTAEAYNIASGESISIAELVELVLQVTEQRRKVVFSDEAGPGEPQRWKVDIGKIQSLGFEPKIALKDGLERFSSAFLSSSENAYV
jgi:UDP-glucose 4-epimerase